MISVQNVSRIYRTETVETHALENVTFSVTVGEYIAVCGPSGCGKSTLLAVLGLLDTASSGTYMFHGIDTAALAKTARAAMRNEHIGFVFQSFHLVPRMSVLENVELPMRYRRGMPRTEARDRAADVLQRVGLEARMQHRPHQLSGGQQQRVAVARAIVGRPSLLLADEPTGNLDSSSGAQIMDLLAELNGAGTTILLVTHDSRHLAPGMRQLRLLDGRLVD